MSSLQLIDLSLIKEKCQGLFGNVFDINALRFFFGLKHKGVKIELFSIKYSVLLKTLMNPQKL